MGYSGKNQKTIFYAHCYGVSVKDLARSYGWRSVRVALKKLKVV